MAAWMVQHYSFTRNVSLLPHPTAVQHRCFSSNVNFNQPTSSFTRSKPREKLNRYYRAAMQLEFDFFEGQGYSPPSTRPINLLVIDFDDTCTAQDTTSMIARAAIAAAAEKLAPEEDRQRVLAEGELKFEALVQNYLQQRGSLLDEILPETALEEELLNEFDMGWLGDFLDRLSVFDREMNSVVLDSGILSGIKRGILSQVGNHVEMRPGCLTLLRNAVDAGIPTAIVSVNWSGEMVTAALTKEGLPVVMAGGGGGARAAGVEGAPPPVGAIVVYCNELEYYGDESTGGMKRRCECARDKGRIFDDLLLGMAAEGQNEEGGVAVYIGDSMTDIPALISADVGIIMGSNQLIRQVAAAAGVPLKPLVAFPVDPNATAAERGEGEGEGEDDAAYAYHEAPTLYEASNWAEIDAFVFGKQFKAPDQAAQTPTPRQLSAMSSGLSAVVHPPRVLSIAGSDSGGGAGIQADIKACTAAGVFSSTAVTALTVQNTFGVAEVHAPPVDFLRAQLRAVLHDLGADAIKTGMLPSLESVECIADELSSLGVFPALIVDPVLVATSGDPLAEVGVAHALSARLFPLATVVTPNVHEASVLLGGRTITDVEGMKTAAEELHAFGPQWVLVKGGHLGVQNGVGEKYGGGDVVDVLFDGRNFIEMRAPYIDTVNNHGTGCTLAAYIAAEMAKGADVPSAVRSAKRYVWRALERSVGLPLGSGLQRPMNHCFRISDWRSDLERQAAAAAEKAKSVASMIAAAAAASSAAAASEDREEYPVGERRNSSTTTQTSSSNFSIGDSPTSPSPLLHRTPSSTAAVFSLPPRVINAVDLRLYAVTDPSMIEASGGSLEEAVSAAIDGGATVIQLREKHCEGGEFTRRAAAALSRCRAAAGDGVPLIINDRIDVALAVGADGVHVGQSDISAAVARRLIGPDGILGVSVKTVEEAVAAEAAGADYLGAGAIFSTSTKDSSVIGVEGFRKVCEAVKIPVVAIGGVGHSGAAEEMIVGAGAAGIAVVSAIFAAENMKKAAAALRAEVDAALLVAAGKK